MKLVKKILNLFKFPVDIIIFMSILAFYVLLDVLD